MKPLGGLFGLGVFLLGLLSSAQIAWAQPFQVGGKADPSEGGTITGLGSYPDQTSIVLQIRANTGWYVREVSFDGPPYPVVDGRQQLTPEERFIKFRQLEAALKPDFDPTTITSFDAPVTVIGDSTTEVVFAPLAPVFGSPLPVTVGALTGTFVTLSSEVAGRRPISLQWRKDGLDLPGETNANLTIPQLQPSQSGAYSLVASNAFGMTNCLPAQIHVRDLLVLADGEPVLDGVLDVGQQTLVSCQSIHSDARIFYTLDGQTPDFEATAYLAPFVVTNNGLLRVIAYSADFAHSSVSEPIHIAVHPLFQLHVSSLAGSVVREPAGPYRSNTLVTVVAVPEPGWVFMGWKGVLDGDSSTNVVVMDGDKTLSAVFGTPLVLGAVGGTVSAHPALPLYPFGSAVTLHGTPDPGRYLRQWFWDGRTSATNSLTLPVVWPTPTVSAAFATLPAGQAALTALPDGEGVVLGGQNTYALGATAELWAVPHPGQEFLGWAGDADGLENPLRVTMDSSRVVRARFSRRPMLSLHLRDDTVHLTVAGPPGAVFPLHSSTNLTDWSLSRLLTNYVDEAVFSEPVTDAPIKAYRIVEP